MPHEWPIVETEVFEGETRTKKTYENGAVVYELRAPSQAYINNKLVPTRPRAAEIKAEMAHSRERSIRLNQLGDARCTDPARIAEEDAVLDGATSVIATGELNQIIAQLEWFGDKTLVELDDYIENHTGNVADIRVFLKTLTRIVWATLNLTRIVANRELPPNEE